MGVLQLVVVDVIIKTWLGIVQNNTRKIGIARCDNGQSKLALRFSLAAPLRLLLVTGFLGGYTTFSAFSLEGALMLERGDYFTLALYVFLSVAGCLAAVFLGGGLIKALP